MIFQNHLNVLTGLNVKCISLRYPRLSPLSRCLRCASTSTKTIFSTGSPEPRRESLQKSRLTCDQTVKYQSSPSRRYQSTQKEQEQSTRSTSLSEVKGTSGQLTIGEKVKQTTKDAYYTGIVIAGIAVTGIMFYTIFRELFSKQSPNGVYTDALKLCKGNSKIVDAIGEPIKGHGETTSRGRRRHVSHIEFEKDGVKCMRMKFYVQGSRRRGTVHLEVQQNDRRKYDYRYLFVELDGYPNETIILQDNR